MGNKGIVALKPGPLVESCLGWKIHVAGKNKFRKQMFREDLYLQQCGYICCILLLIYIFQMQAGL